MKTTTTRSLPQPWTEEDHRRHERLSEEFRRSLATRKRSKKAAKKGGR